MKHHFYLRNIIVFLLIATACQGQSFITVDGAQAFSNFKFINSSGERDDGFSNLAGAGYSLGYRHYKSSGLFIRLNAGMRKGGAIANYDNSEISWDLQYLDIRAGAGYEYNKRRLKPYLSIAPYYSFLLKAYQSMDGLTYDLKVKKEVKPSDFGLLVIPGLRFQASDYFSLYSEFSYLNGLQNIETDDKQKLYNRTFMISVGIAVTITKSTPKWLQGK